MTSTWNALRPDADSQQISMVARRCVGTACAPLCAMTSGLNALVAFTVSCVSIGVLLSGCADNANGQRSDEQNVTSTPPSSLYVAVATNASGGLDIKLVNIETTRCADSSQAAYCPVLGLDYSALGLSEEKIARLDASFARGSAIVRGMMANAPKADGAVLKVSEAWDATTTASGSNDTPLYLIHPSPPGCSGCDAFDERLVNTPRSRSISWIDFGTTSASTAVIESAKLRMGSAAGLLVTGATSDEGVDGGGKRDVALHVRDFYSPVTP